MSTIAQDASAPRRALSRIHRARGETREIVLEHAEAGGRIGARLVRVEGGGVDRTTGQPLKVYFELTVKLPRQPEVTRTFSSERPARVAYLVAQYGVSDFSAPLAALEGPRLWEEPKNMAAQAKLPADAPEDRPRHRACPMDCWCRSGEAETGPRTRMNSGDSHADPAARGRVACLTRPARSEAPIPLGGAR